VDVVFYLTGDVLDIPGSPIFLLVLMTPQQNSSRSLQRLLSKDEELAN
jgi:hypothetical protein